MTQLSRFKQLTLPPSAHFSLETLDISFAVENDKNRLPENLFHGKSPRLTCLKVLRCGSTWRGPIFTNLQSLDVCEVPEALRPPAEQVISALCSMHHLETLPLFFDFALPAGLPSFRPESRKFPAFATSPYNRPLPPPSSYWIISSTPTLFRL